MRRCFQTRNQIIAAKKQEEDLRALFGLGLRDPATPAKSAAASPKFIDPAPPTPEGATFGRHAAHEEEEEGMSPFRCVASPAPFPAPFLTLRFFLSSPEWLDEPSPDNGTGAAAERDYPRPIPYDQPIYFKLDDDDDLLLEPNDDDDDLLLSPSPVVKHGQASASAAKTAGGRKRRASALVQLPSPGQLTLTQMPAAAASKRACPAKGKAAQQSKKKTKK